MRKPIMFIVGIAAVLICLSGCSLNRRKTAATEKPGSSPAIEETADFVGVVKSVDTLNQTIRCGTVMRATDIPEVPSFTPKTTEICPWRRLRQEMSAMCIPARMGENW